MLSEKKAKSVLHILVPVLIAVVCYFWLSKFVPNMKFVQESLESIKNSMDTVGKFAGATLTSSLAISALPGDIATPLANEMAGMDKYFVFITIVLFIERILVINGIKIALSTVMPISCLVYLAGHITGKDMIRNFGYKLAILALSIILVVPCSTHLSDTLAKDYLVYVDETIEKTAEGAELINGPLEDTENDEGQGFLDKVEGLFDSAAEGVTGMIEYFKDMIKKCINAIAILIITTFIIPILTFIFFRWLLKELFSVNIPMIEHMGTYHRRKKHDQHAKEDTNE